MLRLERLEKEEKPLAKGKFKRWLEPDGLILLEGWARDGLTDEQIANKMGINVATLYRYKQSYCEICNALKKGKEVVDFQVENALVQAALDGNVTAQIFWLKNRRPDKWRDKPEAADSGGKESGVVLLAPVDESLLDDEKEGAEDE